MEILKEILLLCIICSIAAASTSAGREELISAAISSVKAEFAAQQNAVFETSSTQKKLHAFKMATPETRAQGDARLRFEKMVKKAEKNILEKQRLATAQNTEAQIASLAMEVLHTPGSLLTKQEIARMYQESGCHDAVPSPPDCTTIPTNQRTAGGLCNNLQNPIFGAANTPMRRLIPSQYDDGISRLQGLLQIRNASIVPGPFSPPNPSARVVSLGVVNDRPVEDSRFTHILMQWGQFMDHDLDAMPEFEMRDCPHGCDINEDMCVPIPVPKDDDRVSITDNSFCLEFRRSRPACDGDMHRLTPREQLNSITHFIDGSMVYHHNETIQSQRIRDPDSRDGLLREGPVIPGTSRNSLPLIDDNEPLDHEVVACPNPPCYLAGDFRVNEQTGLTTMHTIWVREHNRIARELRRRDPRATSDTIFQTARNIVIAEIQKITYKDYLPLLLGDKLIPDYTGYNPSVNPNIPNAFATAAFRYGHSQIQPFFERLGPGYQPIPAGPLSLVDAFFNISHFVNNGGPDPILRGMVSDNARLIDEFLNEILTNQLFASNPGSPGMDLAALNVQRGRDHGLPKYLTWKQWAKKTCNVESEFLNELTHIHLLQTYGGLRNVDLFVGGLAERPLPGGALGAVFSCIFAQTFTALRDGDRFYYENKAGSPRLFTDPQLAEIEEASLSRVICDNTDISEIQRNAFLAGQVRVSCSQLPSVDLAAWSRGPISLPNLCFMKISNMANRQIRYTSISRRENERRCRVSRHMLYSSSSSTCLSFKCPTTNSGTRLTVSSNRRCRITKNVNLKPSRSGRSFRYKQTLSAEDINSQSGLYTNSKDCDDGKNIAFTFCGDKEVMSLSQSSATVEQEDIDADISDQEELRKILAEAGEDGEDVDFFLNPPTTGTHQESKNTKLIALMESVLETLKDSNAEVQYQPNQEDDEQKARGELHDAQESDIAELENALKKLN